MSKSKDNCSRPGLLLGLIEWLWNQKLETSLKRARSRLSLNTIAFSLKEGKHEMKVSLDDVELEGSFTWCVTLAWDGAVISSQVVMELMAWDLRERGRRRGRVFPMADRVPVPCLYQSWKVMGFFFYPPWWLGCHYIYIHGCQESFPTTDVDVSDKYLKTLINPHWNSIFVFNWSLLMLSLKHFKYHFTVFLSHSL